MAGLNGINIDANNLIKPAFDFFGKFVDLIPNKNKQAEFVAEAQRLEYEARNKLNELEQNIQAQMTERHKADMMSDSWLSKNIRPLTLVVLSGWFLIVFVLTYFGIEASAGVMDLLKTLLVSAFQFYFGGRTIEKGAKMISSVLQKNKK